MTSIATERLQLRPLTSADAAPIGKFLRDWEVASAIASMPLPQPEICAEGFILIMEARRGLGRDHVFAIDLPGVGLIGLAGAHARGPDKVEIGYWIGRPYWGAGYATEVGRALADYARTLGIGPVTAGHFADNPASGKVLQKAGFSYTGAVESRFSVARRTNAPVRMMQLDQAA